MRFNFNATTHKQATEYLQNRAIQLLRFNFKLLKLIELEWGVVALFEDLISGDKYQSVYLLEQFRSKGLYKTLAGCHSYPILTSEECNIEDFLKKQGFQYKCIKIEDFPEYKVINHYYGSMKTKRSDVYYMNHIDEGLDILNQIGAEPLAYGTYCLHPIYQSDSDLIANYERNFYLTDKTVTTSLLAMEYRSIANDYLSTSENKQPSQIRLSPILAVNQALVADKIQNYKDFLLYHKGKHANSRRLEKYFIQWLRRLNCETHAENWLKKYDLSVNWSADN